MGGKLLMGWFYDAYYKIQTCLSLIIENHWGGENLEKNNILSKKLSSVKIRYTNEKNIILEKIVGYFK